MAHIKRLFFCGIRRLNAYAPFAKSSHSNRDGFDYSFGDVNIFIGVNGGGKSTVLDLIDAVREPSRFVSLPRENKRRTEETTFTFEFEDGASLKGRSYPYQLDSYSNASNVDDKNALDSLSLGLRVYNCHGNLRSFSKNVSKSELDSDSRTELKELFLDLGCEIEYWNSQSEPSPSELVECLNRAASFLPGVFSPSSEHNDVIEDEKLLKYKGANPFHTRNDDDKRVSIWLSDDILQKNHVHISALPSGWRRIASILTWLKNVPQGSICLIEEPETHLHPRLQRYLATMVEFAVTQKSLQIFIATHSTVFQQSNLWSKQPKIFAAKGDLLEEYSDAWAVMDALGIRGSDLSQSNGIVWVEGPSDRIYIKHWLSLFCKKNRLKEPEENVDYSFNLYGGAVLSHLSASERKSFVCMLSMNQNFVLVMDRDADFKKVNGELVCKNPSSSKARVLTDIDSIIRNHVTVWITDRYTIESYLPLAFRKKYFVSNSSGRLTLLKSSKTSIAKTYSQTFCDFDGCSDIQDKLAVHINNLYNSIKCWNS